MSRTKRSKRFKYVAALTSRPHSRLAPAFRRGFTFPQRRSGLPPLHRIRLSVENRQQIYDLFSITNKLSHSFFAKTRVSALPRKRGNYVCISKGILPGGESGLWIYETVLFFYNKPVSYLSFRLCLERLFGHVRHFSSSDSPLSSSSG